MRASKALKQTWRDDASVRVSMGSRKRLKEVKYCAHERKERERCVCVPFLPLPNTLPPFALLLTQNNTANTHTIRPFDFNTLEAYPITHSIMNQLPKSV